MIPQRGMPWVCEACKKPTARERCRGYPLARMVKSAWHKNRAVAACFFDLTSAWTVRWVSKTEPSSLRDAGLMKTTALESCSLRAGHSDGRLGKKTPRPGKLSRSEVILPWITFGDLPFPTATTTATTATTTSATTTGRPSAPTTTPAAATLPKRARFVYDPGPTQEALAVQRGDGAIGLFIVGDFHEAEAARLSREAIADQGDALGFHTCLSKPCLQLLLGCLER